MTALRIVSSAWCMSMEKCVRASQLQGHVQGNGVLGIKHVVVCRLAQARPQEAAFVLSLLNPDPEGRPTVDTIVRSELLLELHRSIRQRRQAPGAGARHPLDTDRCLHNWWGGDGGDVLTLRFATLARVLLLYHDATF